MKQQANAPEIVDLDQETADEIVHRLAHGRRAFVDIVDHFPEKCLYVLQALKTI